MPRAPKICSHPGCPALQPCADHPKIPWASSSRRERTVSGSAQQKRARRVLYNHGFICHICNQPGATQVDHVTPLSQGGPDSEHNLRPAHKECHTRKTQREAAAARRTT